ncbi:MAG: ArsR/SmtB family transcription factor [Roseiflexaceae bacterium]
MLFEKFARIGRSLATPHRLELLDLFAQGERTVEDLASQTALSIANTSQQLQILRAAQLVTVRRNDLYAYLSACRSQYLRTVAGAAQSM